MRFFGNEICCGSYACLNAMQDPMVDLQLFEISTSTPFGLKHCENNYFDRLITTFCDPNNGMDRALRLWGYHVKTYRLDTSDEAIECIRRLLGKGHPVLVGPIDMGTLDYQIMPSLLKRMDHYVLLEFFSKEAVLCTDLEGFQQYQMDYTELFRYLSVDGIPEAEGSITVRQIEKEHEYTIEGILEQSLGFAAGNLRAAEICGEGSHAIGKCFEYLEQYKEYKWRLPLMYDIQYLKQRKLLQLLFFHTLEKYGIRNREEMKNIKKNVLEQNDLMSAIYMKLRKGEGIDGERFNRLAEMEEKVAEGMGRLYT